MELYYPNMIYIEWIEKKIGRIFGFSFFFDGRVVNLFSVTQSSLLSPTATIQHNTLIFKALPYHRKQV